MYGRWYLAFRDGTVIVAGWGEDGEYSRILDPRYDLGNHTFGPFDWGLDNPGCRQLSLAILADALDNDETAVAMQKRFKWEVLTCMDHGTIWALTQEYVVDWWTGAMPGLRQVKEVQIGGKN